MSRDKHATHEYTSFFNPWAETNTLHMNIPRSFIYKPRQAPYTWMYLVLLSMSRDKNGTQEYTSFFYPWAKTRTLHVNLLNLPRCFIQEPRQHTTREFTLFSLLSMSQNKCAACKFTNTLHVNLPHSFINEPRQASYMWIYLVRLSLSRVKHASCEFTLFFHSWAETIALHVNLLRCFIHKPRQTRCQLKYLALE